MDHFYVGAKGHFDHMVNHALIELSHVYPNIKYHVVLPTIPQKEKLPGWVDLERTIVPEGIEKAPPRFAVVKCNQWMLDRSDYVVGYAIHPFGGAAKFFREAERKGKITINLEETIEQMQKSL